MARSSPADVEVDGIEIGRGEVIEQPRNDMEQWLMNTVAQQSRQAGIAMPQVAIYHAPDINAFATGARRDASLVAVSTGLLQNMSRDEAEAVIAHEISHIANGDMVTMTLIQGVVNTFVIFISRILAQIAAGFMGGNRDEGEEQRQPADLFCRVDGAGTGIRYSGEHHHDVVLPPP